MSSTIELREPVKVADAFARAAGLPVRSEIIVKQQSALPLVEEFHGNATANGGKTIFYRETSGVEKSALARLVKHLARIAAASDFAAERNANV